MRIILAASFAVLFVISVLRKSMGFLAYAITLGLAVTVIVGAIWRQTWKDFPREADIFEEQTTTIEGQSEVVLDAIPIAIQRSHWRLIEADRNNRHFKVKIRRTMATLGGQEMLIDLKEKGPSSSIVTVRCEAVHQIVDWGKNRKCIDRFFGQLKKQLASR